MKKAIIAPSLLSCDFANIQNEIALLTEAGADWLHLDVMDGHFVPNITFGPPVIYSIRTVSQIPLDVHLMIDSPEKYIKDFVRAGSDSITIHVESTKNVKEVLKEIKSFQVTPGITLRPKTSVEEILPHLEDVGLVLVMTVEPGFGGQSFMPDQVEKIKILKSEIKKRNLNVLIEVDGGINKETAKVCRDAGANVFVAGNYIFTRDYKEAINSLR